MNRLPVRLQASGSTDFIYICDEVGAGAGSVLGRRLFPGMRGVKWSAATSSSARTAYRAGTAPATAWHTWRRRRQSPRPVRGDS
jgi:hypothetical protein